MNRFISVGLSIAIAPAILVVVGQLIGSSDTVHVSSWALLFIAIPFGGFLVVVGLFLAAAKKMGGSVPEENKPSASESAENADLRIGENHPGVNSKKQMRYIKFFAACIGLFLLLGSVAMAVATFISHQTTARIFTPLFWFSVYISWKIIFKDDKDHESRG